MRCLSQAPDTLATPLSRGGYNIWVVGYSLDGGILWPVTSTLNHTAQESHDPLSLATHWVLQLPLWVGARSTGDGFGQRWGRNGKSCPPQQWALSSGLMAYTGLSRLLFTGHQAVMGCMLA